MARSRAATWLVLVTLALIALFQSHWVDDYGTGDPDVAGKVVSGIGTALLALGLLMRKKVRGRVLLALGYLFTAFISAADLSGLDETGAFAPDVVAHWREFLGWPVFAAVVATFALSLTGMALLTVTAKKKRPAAAATKKKAKKA